MEKKEDCGYWEKLKTAKTKISIQTKDNKFWTGIVLECSDTGIILLDKFGDEIFLNFENIFSANPWSERNNKEVIDHGNH